MKKVITFIDLFCGLGGMRIGFESACKSIGINSKCVFSSDNKKQAVETYKYNFTDSEVDGDISKISSEKIPDFDFLLAGFPCQPFSTAGTRQGFLDTRGTLFFEIERIINSKKPYGFLLENVDNLEKHDHGRTLSTILFKLKQLGYQTSYGVLNASDFGLPQERKRIYIVGTKTEKIDLNLKFCPEKISLSQVLEKNKPLLETDFVKNLLSHYKLEELYGKSIKDKRGGKDNIHSWDLELKGSLTQDQKDLLNSLLKQRRRKEWAEKKGIKWMDGMPLTLDEILTFYPQKSLFNQNLTKEKIREMLDDMVNKRYLRFEYPKDLVNIKNSNNTVVRKRVYREDLPKGYNIVTGKLSFEINKILDPYKTTPTLLATDMGRLAVVDGDGIRKLTIREGLRLFGFPEHYQINLPLKEAYDLLGNTVAVPVIEKIAEQLVRSKVKHSFAHNLVCV